MDNFVNNIGDKGLLGAYDPSTTDDKADSNTLLYELPEGLDEDLKLLVGTGEDKKIHLNEAVIDSIVLIYVKSASGIRIDIRVLKKDGFVYSLRNENANSLCGFDDKDILSIMVKTADEAKGYIDDDGEVVKINTIQDIRYLAEGVATAGFILCEAGVDPSTIGSTVYRGAHPGGTAAIGKVVDSNQETKIKGLFVSDASVLPVSPGKPPILTILALSKRLADYLKNE